jgi:hypothetical protein
LVKPTGEDESSSSTFPLSRFVHVEREREQNVSLEREREQNVSLEREVIVVYVFVHVLEAI